MYEYNRGLSTQEKEEREKVREKERAKNDESDLK